MLKVERVATTAERLRTVMNARGMKQIPEEAGRCCCDSLEYAISGTRSAPLASSHGAAEDAVDEIEDAHGTLCKQSLDLTDVLDTVHVASPFCGIPYFTIFA